MISFGQAVKGNRFQSGLCLVRPTSANDKHGCTRMHTGGGNPCAFVAMFRGSLID
jgi:hypothetical protein